MGANANRPHTWVEAITFAARDTIPTDVLASKIDCLPRNPSSVEPNFEA